MIEREGGECRTSLQIDLHSIGTCMDDHQCLGCALIQRVRVERESVDLRDRMWRATCWGRVKVAWQTGHL